MNAPRKRNQVAGVLELIGTALFEPDKLSDRLHVSDGAPVARAPTPAAASSPATSSSSAPCVRCDGEREVVIRGVVAACPLCKGTR